MSIALATSYYNRKVNQHIIELSKFRPFLSSLKMDGLDNVRLLADNLDASIESLQEALQPILSTSFEDRLAKCTTPEEKATLYHEQIYIIDSILFSYLKVSGVKTEGHPIMKELERIKLSMNKLKQLKQSNDEKASAEEESSKKTAEFLQRTLGTSGGLAVPENMKSPAISSANFKGKHTKFEEK